jgi:hypothetical protein
MFNLIKKGASEHEWLMSQSVTTEVILKLWEMSHP